MAGVLLRRWAGSAHRTMMRATIPILRSPHAPPDTADTRLSDVGSGFCTATRTAACPAATGPDQRADRLRHKDREEVPSIHLPLSVQEQDPHLAQGCQGAGIDCL